MADVNDMDLMREYLDHHSEPAFAELVQRHINLVYSVALRYAGNPQDAQDVTQAVFTILVKKINRLRQRATLTGWLYETTRLAAGQLLRTKTRQQIRDHEAYMQSTLQEPETQIVWNEIEPILEEAMSRLNEKERALLALRFFENKSMAETATLLGLHEWAARKRVSRAIEKLQNIFLKRGVKSTAESLSRTISNFSVQPAPALLAKTVTAVALAKGATASISTATLIKGALKLMAWTKAKTAIVTGAVLLLATGTATVTIKQIHQRNLDAEWDTGKVDSRILDKAPHIVRIIPTKFPTRGGWAMSNYRSLGINGDIRELIDAAYGGYYNRTIYLTPLPKGKYDFIANLPNGSDEAMEKEIQNKFGLVGRLATVETNVLFLKVALPDAPGLKKTTTHNGSSSSTSGNGQFKFSNQSASSLARVGESVCKIPVVDQTGLPGNYDIQLKWDNQNDPDHENFKQALKDQLGLELVPGTAPIEFLFIEKAK